MYIIKLEASPNGSRPPLQSWDRNNIVPDGYAVCPEEFAEIFYSTSPAGFVNITVDLETRTVTSMAVNQEALDSYVASIPEPEKPQPTPQDDTDSMLVDLEYRMTMIELGITE